ARNPDGAQYVTSTTPSGGGQSSRGSSWTAACITSIHNGTALAEPVCPGPMGVWSSSPTHTPMVYCFVKPTYHASVNSLVVPVLPPEGCRIPEAHTAAAVPRM